MTTNPAIDDDFTMIQSIINTYFTGLYQGNSDQLKAIFHPTAMLKSPGNFRSLERWLEDVETRATPESLGQPFNFKILSIEIIHDQAMVKLECPLFDYFYIDFLGLLKEQGRWLIVNKMYTDIAQTTNVAAV
ncbi:nuclear transport factor 2 family protein [Neptuniibacter sp. QD48_55]|uniref:nuclear transport factor 2 family protein n=1 Tax=Neptuniibacter sp. QD48_55 TaxID=3398212 RepID=UPI0039F48BA3